MQNLDSHKKLLDEATNSIQNSILHIEKIKAALLENKNITDESRSDVFAHLDEIKSILEGEDLKKINDLKAKIDNLYTVGHSKSLAEITPHYQQNDIPKTVTSNAITSPSLVKEYDDILQALEQVLKDSEKNSEYKFSLNEHDLTLTNLETGKKLRIHDLTDDELSDLKDFMRLDKLTMADLKSLSDKERLHAHIEVKPYALTRKTATSTIDKRIDNMHRKNPHNVIFIICMLSLIALMIATKSPAVLIFIVALIIYKILRDRAWKKHIDKIR